MTRLHKSQMVCRFLERRFLPGLGPGFRRIVLLRLAGALRRLAGALLRLAGALLRLAPLDFLFGPGFRLRTLVAFRFLVLLLRFRVVLRRRDGLRRVRLLRRVERLRTVFRDRDRRLALRFGPTTCIAAQNLQ